jgi:hypothetical protein
MQILCLLVLVIFIGLLVGFFGREFFVGISVEFPPSVSFP